MLAVAFVRELMTPDHSTKGARMKLKDQVAIVTGAGRNIGEEIAKLFAAEGAKVAVVDLDKPRGERVAGAIKADGRRGRNCSSPMSPRAARSRRW